MCGNTVGLDQGPIPGNPILFKTGTYPFRTATPPVVSSSSGLGAIFEGPSPAAAKAKLLERQREGM